MKLRFLHLWVFSLFTGLGLTLTEPAFAQSPVVMASIPPQAGLLKRLAQSLIDVKTLLPVGQDPHTYSPSPKQVEQMTQAKLFFAIGLPFEDRLLTKLQGGGTVLRVVDTTKGMQWRDIEETPIPGHHDHDDEKDPHVWLSPTNLRLQISTMTRALEELLPQHISALKASEHKTLALLDQIDGQLQEAFLPHRGKSVYVFHPAFGYFTDAYGLRQRPLEIKGKQPTPKQLGELIKQARQDGTKLILVQPQADQRSAKTLARSIEGSLVVLDPMAEDVLTNLQEMARVVQQAVSR